MRMWLPKLTVGGWSFAALALLAAASMSGCENYDGIVVVGCPPAEEFRAVSQLAEKRCGTIDCHGGLARPLRIYGQGGLRLDPEDVPGGRATTADELRENRESMCNLEPERMIQFQTGEITARDLMLLRKPLELERHKGGPVLEEGNLGLTCLESWLQGEPNTNTCQTAANQP